MKFLMASWILALSILTSLEFSGIGTGSLTTENPYRLGSSHSLIG